MSLRKYKTTEELQALLDSEIKGEKRERPENNFLENSLRIAITGEFTATELEVYGYPASDPQYFFLFEYSDLQYPYYHIRKPLSGHNADLLEAATPLVIERTKELLDKHGKALVVGDEETCDAFSRHLSAVTGAEYRVNEKTSSPPCGVFYMTPAQRDALSKGKSDAPDGFTFETVNVDRDGDTIHELWKHGISAEITKNRLRYLPSLCARNDQGDIVGWVMAARFGQISNLYTMPEYRNRGVGVALEISAAKEFARRGMRVFKYVEMSNTSVYNGSLRSPLWTPWMVKDEDNNENPHFNYFKRFELV